MDTKIFNLSSLSKHVLLLWLLITLVASAYTPLFNLNTNNGGKSEGAAAWLKSLLKENPLKTSEDLATFSDAYIALKALGGDHPRASSDIKAYKNFETDSTYSLKDCYYIARVTGSCDNNQIFKTFVARAPTSDEDLISIINEYYYIWTIYKDNYQNSDKSKDFMQTLGSSFVKNVFPYLTTQLKLKVKGESFLKKQVGYVLEMAAFFRKVSKDANEGHITKVVKEGLSSLISESFVTSGDRRAFRSVWACTTDLEINNAILKGILAFDDLEFTKTNAKNAKEFYNWFLSKQRVLQDVRAFASLEALQLLGVHIPTVQITTVSFPNKISVKVVDYLGRNFKNNEIAITGTAKRVKSSKDSTFTLAKQADNTFEANNIESSGSGVYRLTFAITLNKEFTFEEHSTAHIFSEAEFVDAVYTGNAVSFKVNVDKELYKSQVEHAFVEYRHKSNPNLVFVDSENVFLNDKYLFKRVLVDKDHPAGDYDIYIGIIDQSLEKPVIKKLDTYVDKKSKSEAKEQFITKQSYLPNKVIETQFPPEIDYTSQITPQVLVSVAAQIFLLYWYVQKGFSSKILLLSPAVAFFWLFWTQINIMQAFAVMIVGVPYLVVVLWM